MNAEALTALPGTILGRGLAGDTSAFGQLAQHIATETAVGAINYAEGVVMTGFWQRLASSAGDGQALFDLAEVLLAHGTFAQLHDREARAIWLGAEAVRRLEQSADAGHEAATARLMQVSPTLRPECLTTASQWSEDPFRSELAGYDRIFAEAAKGSIAAVSAIYLNAVADVEDNSIGIFEGLVLLEATARLGAASGDQHMGCRLGEVLIRRDRFDHEHGADDPACTRKGECLSILAKLTRDGGENARVLLAQAVDQFPPLRPIEGLLADARRLLNLSPKGSC